jgi:hypothetical protein
MQEAGESKIVILVMGCNDSGNVSSGEVRGTTPFNAKKIFAAMPGIKLLHLLHLIIVMLFML